MIHRDVLSEVILLGNTPDEMEKRGIGLFIKKTSFVNLTKYKKVMRENKKIISLV